MLVLRGLSKPLMLKCVCREAFCCTRTLLDGEQPNGSVAPPPAWEMRVSRPKATMQLPLLLASCFAADGLVSRLASSVEAGWDGGVD